MKLKELLNYYYVVGEQLSIQKDLEKYMDEDCVVAYERTPKDNLKSTVIIKKNENNFEILYSLAYKIIIKGVRKIRLIYFYTIPDYNGMLKTYLTSNSPFYRNLPTLINKKYEKMIIKDKKLFNKYLRKLTLKKLLDK